MAESRVATIARLAVDLGATAEQARQVGRGAADADPCHAKLARHILRFLVDRMATLESQLEVAMAAPTPCRKCGGKGTRRVGDGAPCWRCGGDGVDKPRQRAPFRGHGRAPEGVRRVARPGGVWRAEDERRGD